MVRIARGWGDARCERSGGTPAAAVDDFAGGDSGGGAVPSTAADKEFHKEHSANISAELGLKLQRQNSGVRKDEWHDEEDAAFGAMPGIHVDSDASSDEDAGVAEEPGVSPGFLAVQAPQGRRLTGQAPPGQELSDVFVDFASLGGPGGGQRQSGWVARASRASKMFKKSLQESCTATADAAKVHPPKGAGRLVKPIRFNFTHAQVAVMKNRAAGHSKLIHGAGYVGTMDVLFGFGAALASTLEQQPVKVALVASLRGTGKRRPKANNGGYFGNYIYPVPTGPFPPPESMMDGVATAAVTMRQHILHATRPMWKQVLGAIGKKLLGLLGCCKSNAEAEAGEIDYERECSADISVTTIAATSTLRLMDFKKSYFEEAVTEGQPTDLVRYAVQPVVMSRAPEIPYSRMGADADVAGVTLVLSVPLDKAEQANQLFSEFVASMHTSASTIGEAVTGSASPINADFSSQVTQYFSSRASTVLKKDSDASPSVKRDGSAASFTLAHGGQAGNEGEDVHEDSGMVPGGLVSEVLGGLVSEVEGSPSHAHVGRKISAV